MKSFLRVVVWFLIVAYCCCLKEVGNYKKVLNTIDPEAKCLDGTPGLLYTHEGGETDKFLIYFEGGGFCGDDTLPKTIEKCY